MTTTSKNSTKKPLDTRTPSQIALDTISNAVDEWKKENTPEVIKKKALDILEKNNKEIITKLLGFDDRWGKFELDHCNGRAGESTAGKYLVEQQQIAVKEWLSTVKLPELSATDKKSLMSSFKEDYLRAYRDQLRALAISSAKKDAEEAFTALHATVLMEKIDKTNELLKISS